MTLEIRVILTKKGDEIPVLCIKKGEYLKYLSFDVSLMSRLSSLSVRDIYCMRLDDIVVIMQND